MQKFDFGNKMHIHFIGIGGISMSGIAELLLSKGFTVSGSDSKESDITKRLESLGAKVSVPQSADNITDDIDLVTYTAAIHEDNPELKAVRAKGIKAFSRADILGEIMRNYDFPVSVAGTHGKTTTTSMLSEALLHAEKDPTISVGGILPSIGGNFRVGGDRFFVTEACEYTNSFLSFFQKIGIILNVDADHLDFFKDIDDIRLSFHKFAASIPADGHLIINGEVEKIESITDGLACKVITYGCDEKYDYYATDIKYDELAHASYELHHGDKVLGRIKLSVPGVHNVYNSMAAFIACELLGLGFDETAAAFEAYHGTDRRFQKKGELNGTVIIDDYAHHPTEIEATINAAKHCPHRTIWVAFQPHTYTRTKALFKEFAAALAKADKVVLADIYAARETDTLGVSSKLLADEIKKNGTDAYYFGSFAEIEKFLQQNCINGDMLITMGAGDIYKVGESLLS
ncbi:MAG: UDP-N-acetylmuramate--L-alanine ligase [Lachnospiraceae bacterium]|nr:UDP-N-acetylmuramate--L-alanine ligase [Lachnospiraceae bacterium]